MSGFPNELQEITQPPPSATNKVYRALLAQEGDVLPTVTILENTLGGVPVLSRQEAGQYTFTLADAFPALKTFVSLTGVFDGGSPEAYTATEYTGHRNGSVITFCTTRTGAYALADYGESEEEGLFIQVEILVYP